MLSCVFSKSSGINQEDFPLVQIAAWRQGHIAGKKKKRDGAAITVTIICALPNQVYK
jgi:hypothetical protein